MKQHDLDQYTFDAFWSEEEGCYVGVCFEFDSIVGYGMNPQQALEECEKSVRKLIAENCQTTSEKIPEKN